MVDATSLNVLWLERAGVERTSKFMDAMSCSFWVGLLGGWRDEDEMEY
jgi:hypothetical protein